MLDFITIDGILAPLTDAWRLTGFSRTNTDNGRLYARLATNAGQTTIELFKRPVREAGDLVASGTGVTGAITLTQANASGLSGAVLLLALGAGDGTLLVFYATDADLDAYESELSALLDAQARFAGDPGFERFTALAKREIDGVIRARLNAEGFRGMFGDAPAALANPADLTEAAAYLALSLVFERLSGAPDSRAVERARHYQLRYERALSATRIVLKPSGAGGALLSVAIGEYVLRRG